MQRRLNSLLAATAVLAAALFFFERTTQQPHYKPADFAVYYTASRAWVFGGLPYDRNEAYRCWVEAGGQPDIMPVEIAERFGERWLAIITIPPALVVMAPFAVLPAKPAVITWYVVCAALLLAQTAALAAMMKSSLLSSDGLWLLAGTLVLAPLHMCFGYGQPGGPTISLLVLAMWAATPVRAPPLPVGTSGTVSAARSLLAGAMLAVAAAFKPQLAILFFVYALLKSRWTLLTAATVGLIALSVVALIPLQFRGTPWLSEIWENVRLSEAPGGMSSTMPDSPLRYGMLNLHLILWAITDNVAAQNVIAWSIVAALGAWFLRRAAQTHHTDELLTFSILSTLALLPVYQRFYHAAIMVVPMAWGLAHLRDRPVFAWGAVLFALSFVIPSEAVPRVMKIFGASVESSGGWWWDVVFEPIRTWTLLAGAVFLILAVRQPRRLRVTSGP